MVRTWIESALDGDAPRPIGDAEAEGGLPVLYRIDIADGAGDTDVIVKNKIRVVDAWAVKTAANGGAGDAVTVKNAGNAITDAMSLNINDKAIARASTIDDAQHAISAGGTLRVTAANAANNACVVYVLAVRVE